MTMDRILTAKESLLIDAYETLEAISRQWEEKKLPGDFFTTPHELTELVSELRAMVEIIEGR